MVNDGQRMVNLWEFNGELMVNSWQIDGHEVMLNDIAVVNAWRLVSSQP